ncbi:hypothetical protein Tco_0031804 [Tanacetum coccineum]
MTLDIHNWSSTAHQELHKIVKDENFRIVNQVDARVQNFEKQFLKEAAKFVGDFKSLAKEADESIAKHKALEYEIERLLRAVVSQNIMSIVQNHYVVDTSNLQIELNRMKEKLETCIIKKEKECVVLWNNWSSEGNNIKLAIRNDKSEVICATCMQCLITANHDECVFKYVNGMNSSKKNQSANASESVNQTKHKAHVKKSKNLGLEERLASPRPSKPRICLRWSPTGRMFDLKGKIIASSESECLSDISRGDNACTSNPQEPTSKGFPNSTSFLDSQNQRDLPRDTPIDRVEVLSSLKRASGHGKTEYELTTQSVRQ